MKYLDAFLYVAWGFVIASSLIIMGYNFGKHIQADTMLHRCKSTGMYLTEGYAISCRVLTNEGYAPMIEQEKGKR
jgi:hypothetical protein